MNSDVRELDAFDLVEIALFAERQHSVKVATRAKTKKYDTRKSEFELHYLGAMAEYVVADLFGVSMDRTVHIGGDSGTDLVVNGWRCEVKAHTYTGPNYELFIDGMDVFRADVLVSVQIVSPTKARVVGCISKRRFSELAGEKNYGYGTRLFVPESALSPMSVLTEHTGPCLMAA